jgi:hypothetical protein
VYNLDLCLFYLLVYWKNNWVPCLKIVGLFRHEIQNILLWFWIDLRDSLQYEIKTNVPFVELIKFADNTKSFIMNYNRFRCTYVPCIYNSLFFTPTNAQHIYIYIHTYIHTYINNILYIVSVPTTALQVGRSRVRFAIVSLEFFSDIILQVSPCPWSRLSL